MTVADVRRRARRARRAGRLPARGLPDRRRSVELFTALVEGGCDLVEVGMPYSDPVMDGPAIQRPRETRRCAAVSGCATCSPSSSGSARPAAGRRHDLLEPGAALRRRRVRPRPGRGRRARGDHPGPHPGRGRRVARGLGRRTAWTGSSWSRRRRPRNGSPRRPPRAAASSTRRRRWASPAPAAPWTRARRHARRPRAGAHTDAADRRRAGRASASRPPRSPRSPTG